MDEGLKFDFVGSENSGNGSSFDSDHEGHSALRAGRLLGGLPVWLQGYTPDIVLLHAGTNDALDGNTTESTVNDLMQIIDVLRADNPNVVILLAKLIPIADPEANEIINSLNAEIDGIAAEKNTLQSPVIVVDQNTYFITKYDTYDGVHPNRSGEVVMADRWFAAIMQAVNSHPCLNNR